MKKHLLIIACFIFLVSSVIYVASPITAHTDSLWSLFLATSLIKTGNFNMDEYSNAIPPNDYRIERVNGHLYSTYPIGAPLMAAPIVYVLDHFTVFNGLNLSAFLASRPSGPDVWQVEKFVASIIVAINSMIVFALAIQYLNAFKAVILTILFSLATPAWSTASRGLWQHGPSMLCLSLALYLVVIARRKPAVSPLVALPLVFSYVVRPTNSISIAVFTIYLFIVHRRYFLYYIFCFALFITPFFMYNYFVYRQLLSSYYLPQQLSHPTLEALFGTILSPSRGLFIFSPIFLLSIYGFFRRLTLAGRRLIQEVDIYLIGIIGLHWLAISAFPVWYGGWSIGPRYFTDIVPYLIFFLIPVLEDLPLSIGNSEMQKAGVLIFVCFAAFSIFVHYRCSTNPGPTQWNGKPNDVDKNHNRLWDWSDIQFLRNLCFDQSYQAPKCWLNFTNMTSKYLQPKILTLVSPTQHIMDKGSWGSSVVKGLYLAESQ
jgi:hypothetical protein